jgi:hypothetical protein
MIAAGRGMKTPSVTALIKRENMKFGLERRDDPEPIRGGSHNTMEKHQFVSVGIPCYLMKEVI